MFSRASAAFLNGEKLTSVTILPNFERSLMESWTALTREPMFSWSFTSKMAYPDADSKSACVAIVAYADLVVEVVEQRLKFWIGISRTSRFGCQMWNQLVIVARRTDGQSQVLTLTLTVILCFLWAPRSLTMYHHPRLLRANIDLLSGQLQTFRRAHHPLTRKLHLMLIFLSCSRSTSSIERCLHHHLK